MRILIDTLIALMVVALLGGVLWMRHTDRREAADHDAVRRALQQLEEQAAYQGALGHLSNSPAGYPVHMMPEWFGDALPVNVLLPSEHPWLDLAPPGDTGEHPPDPIAHSSNQAGFWYNPNLGVFRARVPTGVSRQAEIELYQSLNDTTIAVAEDASPDRIPQTYRPVDVTTAQATGQFLETFVGGKGPGAGVATSAIPPDVDEVMVIDVVADDAARPATIHVEPGRWNVPEPTEAASADDDAATDPGVEAENAASGDTHVDGSDSSAEDAADGAADPQKPRRRSLSELLRSAE